MSSNPAVTAKQFEQMMSDLEQVLARLEDSTTSLEDSLAQYERGIMLVRECHTFLSRSEQKIREFAGIGEDGKPRFRQFDHSATYPNDPS